MNQRPSLMEQAGVTEPTAPPAKKSRGGSGVNVNTVKIVVAVVMLLAAVGLVGYSLGWFQGRPPKTDPDVRAQRQERLEEQMQVEQRQEEASRVPRTDAGG